MNEFDCIIVGGGPAGLTAAIYASRLHLRTLVIDRGDSRAALIPLSRNHAGFPEGIAGVDLLARMRAQAATYGTAFLDATAEKIEKTSDSLPVTTAEELFSAPAVLLATGVFNRRPEIPDDAHDAALAAGLIRYCPVCDGYEVSDKRIAVYGSGEHAAKEALFLRGFSAHIWLIAPIESAPVSAEWQSCLHEAGVVQVPPGTLHFDEVRVTLQTYDESLEFDRTRTMGRARSRQFQNESWCHARGGAQRVEPRSVIISAIANDGSSAAEPFADVLVRPLTLAGGCKIKVGCGSCLLKVHGIDADPTMSITGAAARRSSWSWPRRHALGIASFLISG